MTAIIAKRNKYIRHFKIVQATSPDKSISLSEYGIRRSFIFNKLVSQGIISQTFSGRFYLDETKEKAQRKRRKNIIIMFLTALISAIILAMIVLDYFTGDRILMIEKW